MSPTNESPEHFLSLLDKDPTRAMDAFYRFAVRQLLAMPPGPLRGLAEDQREDAIQEITLHCVAQDFRVLRQYDARRGSFAGWFHLVARNRAYDWLRSQAMTVRAEDLRDHPERLDRSSPADRTTWAQEYIDAVRQELGSLPHSCQLLLRGAADGLRPNELAMLLGWGKDKNKKASDDLRACRSRLKQRLAERGFDLAELEDLS